MKEAAYPMVAYSCELSGLNLAQHPRTGNHTEICSMHTFPVNTFPME